MQKDFDFTTEVTVNLSTKDTELGDIDSINNIEIDWLIEPNPSKSGMIEMLISVPDQVVMLSGSHFNDDDDDDATEDFEIEVELKGNSDDVTFESDGACYPTEISIKYDKKTDTWSGSLS